jgi:hypothetical protein
VSQRESKKISKELLIEMADTISALKFSYIEITMHEGKVTQIEKREKL